MPILPPHHRPPHHRLTHHRLTHHRLTHRRLTHHRPPPLRLPAGRGETGSLSLFAVVVALAMLIVVGLVVDGGGKVATLQRAQAAAREAARAAGQAIDVPAAVQGNSPVADPADAIRAARAHLAAAGMEGDVRVSGARIEVTTRGEYQPVFLSLVGLGAQRVTGHAEARLVRALDGRER